MAFPAQGFYTRGLSTSSGFEDYTNTTALGHTGILAMTNDEIPNDEGNPNDECQKNDQNLPRVVDCDTCRSAFGFRHSFVIGYFVIRH